MTSSKSEGADKKRGPRWKVIFMAVLMGYGLVLFFIAHYLRIDVTSVV